MVSLQEVLSLVLVGVLWGCTNPLIRKGSEHSESAPVQDTEKRPSSVFTYLGKFRNIKVWLPFALNQSGSLLYYYALSQSDLSLAVTICNGLALVFSIVTSYSLGERVDSPLKTVVGSTLILSGVTLCLQATGSSERTDHQLN